MRTLPRLSLILSALFAIPAAGCVVVGPGDDGADDSAEDGGTGRSSASAGDDDDDDDDDDDTTGGGSADETSSGADGSSSTDEPRAGRWIYTETGNTVNDCDFLDDVSNGWGDFEIESLGGGAFRVLPDDGTDPFDCSAGDGAFSCPERLVDEMMSGSSALQVLVSVAGTLDSDTEMGGTQNGMVVCEGAECPLAEELLGTSLPCSFSVEFDGSYSG